MFEDHQNQNLPWYKSSEAVVDWRMWLQANQCVLLSSSYGVECLLTEKIKLIGLLVSQLLKVKRINIKKIKQKIFVCFDQQ